MDNEDYKFYLNKGIEETNNGKLDAAIISLEKSIALNPSSALAYFSKAAALYAKGDINSAYNNFSKSIELDANMIDSYYNRALIILSDSNASQDALVSAEKDFKKAVELDDKFVDAYYYLAVARKKLGDYSGALRALNKSLELEPDGIYSKALKKLILQKYLRKL